MKKLTISGLFIYQLILGWANFSLIIPGVYLLFGLPLVMRKYGWSGTDIGIFQLAGLPAVLKLLLAWPVQRLHFGKKHYSYWVWLLLLPMIVALFLMTDTNMLSHRYLLFLLTLCVSFLAVWADIPLSALAIKVLPRSEQMRAGGIRAMAVFSGVIAGSGIMLVLQAHLGWSFPFYIMSLNLAISLILILFLNENYNGNNIKVLSANAMAIDIPGYFRQPGAKMWIFLSVAAFPFVAVTWLYLKPMLSDLGMDTQHVAWVVGIGGGSVGAIASLLSNRFIRYVGIVKAIYIYLFGSCLALFTLTLFVFLDLSEIWITISVFLMAIAMGSISSLAFGLIMLFTRPKYKASDYGFQSSLFSIARLVLPVCAGVLLDIGGYCLMLTGMLLGNLAVLIFALSNHKTIKHMVKHTLSISKKNKFYEDIEKDD